MTLTEIALDLAEDVEKLSFAAPVTHVYNPLRYAWKAHQLYLERWGQAPKEVLLVGMNPGPWGMVQTGVPFGEVKLVQNWIGISDGVEKPSLEHARRPIQGFECSRQEVSGARLWGWARERFGTPEGFFRRFFVYNYCPLAFLETSGRNRTPDKLKSSEKSALFEICDRSLERVVTELRPRIVLGVGVFAEARAHHALRNSFLEVGRILHPSPASPKANRGWAAIAEAEMAALGISLTAAGGG